MVVQPAEMPAWCMARKGIQKMPHTAAETDTAIAGPRPTPESATAVKARGGVSVQTTPDMPPSKLMAAPVM